MGETAGSAQAIGVLLEIQHFVSGETAIASVWASPISFWLVGMRWRHYVVRLVIWGDYRGNLVPISQRGPGRRRWKGRDIR